MGYYIDLEKITIDGYRNKLESAYLPPSRMILKDKLDERFGYFRSIGLKNVKELIQLLKKKGQVRRTVNGWMPVGRLPDHFASGIKQYPSETE